MGYLLSRGSTKEKLLSRDEDRLLSRDSIQVRGLTDCWYPWDPSERGI